MGTPGRRREDAPPLFPVPDKPPAPARPLDPSPSLGESEDELSEWDRDPRSVLDVLAETEDDEIELWSSDTEPDEPHGWTAPPPAAPPLAEPPPAPVPPPVLPPVVPPRDRAPQRHSRLRWARAHYSRVAWAHTKRAPIYTSRLIVCPPRGTWRAARSWTAWTFDAESKPLRLAARDENKHAAYRQLTRDRDRRVKRRLILSGGVATAAIGATGAAAWQWPISPWIVVFVALVLTGWHGRRHDRPLIDPAVITTPGATRLTHDALTRALIAAKLCSDADPARILAPGVFRDGDGFGATIDLPGKASAAIRKLEDLAAALGVDEARLFLSRVRGDAGSANRLALWLADRDPYTATPPITPLAQASYTDLWSGVPFGLDARGRLVLLNLIWSSLLVGGVSQTGKTNAARLPVAAAALDPHVRLIVADGKGGKDWRAFEHVAHWYGAGVRTVVVKALLGVLRDAVADMDRRYEVLGTLSDEQCPEGRLTPKLARGPSLNMPLTLIAIDEIHRYLADPDHGGEIAELLTELAKVGAGAGYMLVLATQKPDASVIPPGLRDHCGTRFALRVMTWQSSEAVLGAGTHAAGLDASEFLRAHRGAGILLGAEDAMAADVDPSEADAQTVRAHLLDLPTLTAIIGRAYELRARLATLSGAAAGQQVIVEDAAMAELLRDVLRAFDSGEDRLWSETICARLTELDPATYDGWDAVMLGRSLKSHGVDTAQIADVDPNDPHGRRRNRKGVHRQDIVHALAS